jgi:hypothetical protein
MEYFVNQHLYYSHSSSLHLCSFVLKIRIKLRGISPQAHYTD